MYIREDGERVEKPNETIVNDAMRQSAFTTRNGPGEVEKNFRNFISEKKKMKKNYGSRYRTIRTEGLVVGSSRFATNISCSIPAIVAASETDVNGELPERWLVYLSFGEQRSSDYFREIRRRSGGFSRAGKRPFFFSPATERRLGANHTFVSLNESNTY